MTTPQELRELNSKIAKLKGMTLVPRFSEKIEIAWELFEEMDGMISILSLKNLDKTKLLQKDIDLKNPYRCQFMLSSVKIDNCDGYNTVGATAPEAICRAWIKWKESSMPTTTGT